MIMIQKQFAQKAVIEARGQHTIIDAASVAENMIKHVLVSKIDSEV
jgi:hypothetical protein